MCCTFAWNKNKVQLKQEKKTMGKKERESALKFRIAATRVMLGIGAAQEHATAIGSLSGKGSAKKGTFFVVCKIQYVVIVSYLFLVYCFVEQEQDRHRKKTMGKTERESVL